MEPPLSNATEKERTTTSDMEAARELRKGGRDAGLVLEERGKIINLERKVTKLERRVAKREGAPKKGTPKRNT